MLTSHRVNAVVYQQNEAGGCRAVKNIAQNFYLFLLSNSNAYRGRVRCIFFYFYMSNFADLYIKNKSINQLVLHSITNNTHEQKTNMYIGR